MVKSATRKDLAADLEVLALTENVVKINAKTNASVKIIVIGVGKIAEVVAGITDAAAVKIFAVAKAAFTTIAMAEAGDSVSVLIGGLL